MRKVLVILPNRALEEALKERLRDWKGPELLFSTLDQPPPAAGPGRFNPQERLLTQVLQDLAVVFCPSILPVSIFAERNGYDLARLVKIFDARHYVYVLTNYPREDGFLLDGSVVEDDDEAFVETLHRLLTGTQGDFTPARLADQPKVTLARHHRQAVANTAA